MVSQSFTILIVTFVLIIVYARRTNLKSATSLLPIFLVPMGYITSMVLQNRLGTVFDNIPVIIPQIGIGFIFLSVACVSIGVISTKITNRQNKISYVVMMYAYSIVLSIIYLYDIINTFSF